MYPCMLFVPSFIVYFFINVLGCSILGGSARFYTGNWKAGLKKMAVPSRSLQLNGVTEMGTDDYEST